LTQIVFEVADDIEYSDVELVICNVMDKFEHIFKSGKLIEDGFVPKGKDLFKLWGEFYVWFQW